MWYFYYAGRQNRRGGREMKMNWRMEITKSIAAFVELASTKQEYI